MRLQVAPDLTEQTPGVAEPGIAAAVDSDHGVEQPLEPGEGLAQPVVMDRDDMGAQLLHPHLPPVPILDADGLEVALVQGGERGADLAQFETVLRARLRERLAPAAAVVEVEPFEQIGSSGALGDQLAERRA